MPNEVPGSHRELLHLPPGPFSLVPSKETFNPAAGKGAESCGMAPIMGELPEECDNDRARHSLVQKRMQISQSLGSWGSAPLRVGAQDRLFCLAGCVMGERIGLGVALSVQTQESCGHSSSLGLLRQLSMGTTGRLHPS